MYRVRIVWLLLLALGVLIGRDIRGQSFRVRVVETVEACDPLQRPRSVPKYRNEGSEATAEFIPGALLPAQYVCGPIRTPFDLEGKVVLMTSLYRSCRDTKAMAFAELVEIVEPLRAHPNYGRFAFVLDYNWEWETLTKSISVQETAIQDVTEAGLLKDCSVYLNLRGGTTTPWNNVAIQDHLGRVLWGDGRHFNFQINTSAQRRKVTEILWSLLDALPSVECPQTVLTEELEASLRFLEPRLVAGRNLEPTLAFLRRHLGETPGVVSIERQIEAWRVRQVARMRADYAEGCYYAVRQRYERLKATLPSSSECGVEGIEQRMASPFWKRMEALELRAGELCAVSGGAAQECREALLEMAVWSRKLWSAWKSREWRMASPAEVPDISWNDSPLRFIERLRETPAAWKSPLPVAFDVAVCSILREERPTEEALNALPPKGEARLTCDVAAFDPESTWLAQYGQERADGLLKRHCRLLAKALQQFREQNVPIRWSLTIDPTWKSLWNRSCERILSEFPPESIVWDAPRLARPKVRIQGGQVEHLFPATLHVGAISHESASFNLHQPYNVGNLFSLYERMARTAHTYAGMQIAWPSPSGGIGGLSRDGEDTWDFPIPGFRPALAKRWCRGRDLEAEASALEAYGAQHPEFRLEALYCAEALQAQGDWEAEMLARQLTDDPLMAVYSYATLCKTWPKRFAQYQAKVAELRKERGLQNLAKIQRQIDNLKSRLVSENKSVRAHSQNSLRRLIRQGEMAQLREENPYVKASLKSLMGRLHLLAKRSGCTVKVE